MHKKFPAKYVLTQNDFDMVYTLARKLARGDHDVADDLVQEAAITLTETDFSKVRHNHRAARYYCAKTAMQNLLRRERRRKQIESLYAQGASPPKRARRQCFDGAGAKKYRARAQKDGNRTLPVRRNAPRHIGAGPLDDV